MSSDLEAIGESKVPVLIDFYADWCGPCITMEPLVEELESAYKDKLEVVRVDTDKNKALAVGFKVKTIPTFLLFKNGSQVWRKSGLVSKRELKEIIEKHQ